MEVKVWRIIAIVFIALSVLLGIGLILNSRIEKIKIIAIEKVKFIKKNIYVREEFAPDTGNIVLRVTVDKTEETDTSSIKEKEVEKSKAKIIVLSAGYNLFTGTGIAGGGVVLFDFIQIQVLNPVALKFEPTILASIVF